MNVLKNRDSGVTIQLNKDETILLSTLLGYGRCYMGECENMVKYYGATDESIKKKDNFIDTLLDKLEPDRFKLK